jgi:glycosyltransferase involved in cell wall biosynthesis
VRVLLLTEFYPPVQGGLEFHVEALARTLARRGHEVHVASLAGEVGRRDDVTLHRLTSTMSHVPRAHRAALRPFHPPLADPMVRRGVVRLLRSLQPDVVHAHSWIVASVPADRVPPLVLTVHDHAFSCARRDRYYLGRERCSGPQITKCASCCFQHYGALRGPVMAATTPLGVRGIHADAVIAVSHAVASRLTAPMRAQAEVIPNFLPPDILEGTEDAGASLPGESFVMAGGAAEPHKGLDVVIDAWDGRRGFDAALLLALLPGRPLPAAEGAFIATLSRPAMMSAWRRATVAVIPSLWDDPCPTVALEAMAAGRPIVASDVGGLPEILTNEVNGLLVEPGNPRALRAAIGRLLQDCELRERIGAAAREGAEAFSAAAVVPRIELVYRRVIRERRARRGALVEQS